MASELQWFYAKVTKGFRAFRIFRVFRGPNVPGLWVVATRSLGGWLGYARFANTYNYRRRLFAGFRLSRSSGSKGSHEEINQ